MAVRQINPRAIDIFFMAGSQSLSIREMEVRINKIARKCILAHIAKKENIIKKLQIVHLFLRPFIAFRSY